MTAAPPAPPARWYRSFYWRIGFSFVVFVVAVIIAQNAMFSFLVERPPFPRRSPNTIAAMVAADIEASLVEQPDVSLQALFDREYGRLQPIYAVMKTGQVVGNRSEPLGGPFKRSVDMLLAGGDEDEARSYLPEGLPRVAMAPVRVNGDVRGIVVLPPARPPMFAREVGRLLSLPGTLVLAIITAIAAIVIFGPARRRLRALEDASARLGGGDLTARAPEHGGDEIARVATAFNRMAGELAARDEALRSSDRLRRQMLADVSHELKTPLTAMRGFIETLRMPGVELDQATRGRYFATIEHETLRLDRLVKDLVDLARLENGILELDVRLFAMDRLFDHITRRHEQEAKARGISLRAQVDDGADQVSGDPDRLEQALENLVANALRHTPDGGAIRARATREGLELTVTDSGTGILPEHVPNVFDRLYKVDSSRAKGSEGSGLGLSITKAIVERHGGSIRLDSAPGRTVFTITLPADRDRSP